MSFEFKIQMNPEPKALGQRFSQLKKVPEDMRGGFKKLYPMCRDIAEIIFASEGGENMPFNGRSKWQKLSPLYREWKKANYGTLPILQLTGKMHDSFFGGSKHIKVIQKQLFQYGSKDKKAGWHTFANVAFDAPYPTRPVFRPKKIYVSGLLVELTKWLKVKYKDVWKERAPMNSGPKDE